MSSAALVQKLWNYRNILRDDGLSYLLARSAQAGGNYPSALLRTGYQQLTFLLFLKMADEQSRAPFNKRSPIPKEFDWQILLKRDGDDGDALSLRTEIAGQREGCSRRPVRAAEKGAELGRGE
jgi:type I restriction enzyme M protein